MSRVTKWLLGGLAVIAAIVALFLGATAYVFRDSPPPPILGKFECENSDCEKYDFAFRAILKNAFPVGSSAAAMERVLTGQGFEYPDSPPATCTKPDTETQAGKSDVDCPAWDAHWNPHNSLGFGWGRFPCGNGVTVQWSADRSGRITHLESSYNYLCV